jgi:hypothetical protein
MRHLLVLEHDHAAIVQHEPLSIEPRRDNSVVLFTDVVPQDNDPKVISGNTRLLESNKLCDCVVFAIPGSGAIFREIAPRN